MGDGAFKNVGGLHRFWRTGNSIAILKPASSLSADVATVKYKQ